MSNLHLPSIARNEEVSKIETNDEKSNKPAYDYFSTKIPKNQIEFILKRTKDERFLFFIKYGILRRYEGDFELIYVEIPQIPKKLVVYRLPNIRFQCKDKLNLGKRDLPHIPLFEGEENLQYLTLEINHITKLDQLISLNNLIYLNLYFNQISEIENLNCTPKLKVLLLGKNLIERIKGLSCVPDLEILDLHSNKIKTIENISHLKKLRIINLANNQIPSLNELALNKNLEEINIRKNLIVNIPCLSNAFEKLRKLNIGKNLISKIENLIEFTKIKSLKEIILEDNPVLSLSDSFNILQKLPLSSPSIITQGNLNKFSLFNNIKPIRKKANSPASSNKKNYNAKVTPNRKNTQNSTFIEDKNKVVCNSSIDVISANKLKIIIDSNNKTSNIKELNAVPIPKVNNIFNPKQNKKIRKVALIFNNETNSENKPIPLFSSYDGINIKKEVEENLGMSCTQKEIPSTMNYLNKTNTNNLNIESNQISQLNNKNNNGNIEINDISESNQMIASIRKKWDEDYKAIINLGYNGYINKKYKDYTLTSGHCEIKTKEKVILYGNAIKILLNTNIQTDIHNLSFKFFQFDFLMCKKNAQIFKGITNLKKLYFSDNNLHSMYQLIKLENFSGLEKIKIENNEICDSSLVKYFLIYRIQNLKKYNKELVTEEDVKYTKYCFEEFDKCISENEQIRENKTEENAKEESLKEAKRNSACKSALYICNSSKIIIDSKPIINSNDKKYAFFNFVKKNLPLVLKEEIEELNRYDE